MGCDIHVFAEVRRQGRWLSADRWRDPTPEELEDGYQPEHRIPVDRAVYIGRHYRLFGVLADVRWGCPHGAVAPRRGLPANVSPEVRAESDRWGLDGHSHSWCSVAELLRYDWTRPLADCRNVHAEDFVAWMDDAPDRDLPPRDLWEWRRQAGEREASMVEISEEEMRRRYAEFVTVWRTAYRLHRRAERADYAALVAATMGNTYADVTYELPMYRHFPEFLGVTLPKLWRLGDPEDVRLVFWFDN